MPRSEYWGSVVRVAAAAVAVGTPLAAIVLGLHMLAGDGPGELRPARPETGVAAASPGNAVAGQRELAWRAADGALYRGHVDARAWSEFAGSRLDALARARARLQDRAAGLLGAEFDRIFGEMADRVPLFGDWVYGWISNYVTSFDLTMRALESIRQHAAGGEGTKLREAVEADLVRYVEGRYREIVVRPEETDEKLALAWTRTLDTLDAEWRRIVDDHDRAFRTFLDRQARQVDRVASRAGKLDWDVAFVHSTSWQGAAGHAVAIFDGTPTSENIATQGQAQAVFVRATIPIVSQLVSIAIKASAAGSVGAILGLPALGIGVVPGTLTGLALGITAVWTFDYALHRLDADLNRESLEAGVRAAVDQVRADIQVRASTELRGALDANFKGLTDSLRPPAT
ncbi:MAG: hypothetical protein ACT4P2_11030 [Pseudomonadota bacterium]